MPSGGATAKTSTVSKNLKNISVVSGLTMVSRGLGLVRESLTAAVFGASGIVSSFFTGFTLPNLFRRLLAEGGLTAAFVPTLNEELEQRQRPGAFQLVNQVSTWLLIVTGALVASAMALFGREPLVMHAARLVGANASAVERWVLAAHFTVLLFPYLLFVSLSAVFSAALQTLHRFVEPALSPIWLNLSMIGTLVAAWHFRHGNEAVAVQWLCLGVLTGGFLQMTVPALALVNEGWRPRMDFQLSPALRAMLRLMAPTVFSSSIYLVNMSVSRLIGLSLNDAAVAVLNFAQRLMELPIGVFAVAISTVIFPLISRFAAAGDMTNLTQSYRKGMRMILVVTMPAAAGLIVLAVPVVRLVFQHGAFTAAATRLMSPVLVANALAMPFVAFINLALRGFYALKDTVTPVRAALMSFVLNLVLSLVLMRIWSILGLAIASNLAVAAQAVYLQWHLARKDEGLAFRHLIRDVGKVILASAGMGLAVAGIWWAWRHAVPSRKLTDVAGLLVTIVCGMGSYGALVWVLKIDGRQEALALWGKLRARLA